MGRVNNIALIICRNQDGNYVIRFYYLISGFSGAKEIPFRNRNKEILYLEWLPIGVS